MAPVMKSNNAVNEPKEASSSMDLGKPEALGGKEGLSVSRISGNTIPSNLRPMWNSLLTKSKSNTIFLTWEWMASWWESYGGDNTLCILMVWDRDQELIAICPLFLTRRRCYGISVSEIRFIGDGSRDSVYLDIIVAEDKERQAIASILSYLALHHEDWDICRLNTIPFTSSNWETIVRTAESNEFLVKQQETTSSYVHVPGDWKSYEKLIQARFRSRLRNRTKNLKDNYAVEYELCSEAHELEAKLPSLFDLHQNRWEEKDWAGVFSSSARKRFYRLMSERFLENGWLRLYSMKIDGQFVAHQFYMEYANTFFWLIDGFNPRLDHLEVGKVLKGYAFQDAISRKIETIDFLGSITQYKRSWGAQPKTCLNNSLYQKNGSSRMIYELERLDSTVRSLVISHVPSQLRDQIKLGIRKILIVFGIRIQ